MEPQSMGYYTSRLKKFIPREAFKPATYKLIPMSIHVILIYTWLVLISIFPAWWVILLASVLTGISYACLFLYCHELTHGTIVRRQPWRYIAELFYWSFSGMPPTLWQKIHNLNHHKSMNTIDDPDRRTFKSEKNFWNTIYNLFIYPNKTLRFSFTVGFAMIFYTSKHLLAVFYREGTKPSIVTFRPSYNRKEQQKIFLEFLFVLFIQGSMVFILGWKMYMLVALISWFVYSAALIIFIITQHLRNPNFKNNADPLLTATSVKVPVFVDKLIDWHSYHVEHHVFPGINFDYYPVISQKLQEHFPERYQRMNFWKAVEEAYNHDMFEDDPLT
jgi:fatty acid desaturase